MNSTRQPLQEACQRKIHWRPFIFLALLAALLCLGASEAKAFAKIQTGNPQSYNRYSYCVNDPLRYTDPTGHASTIFSVSFDLGGGKGRAYYQPQQFGQGYGIGAHTPYPPTTLELAQEMLNSAASASYNPNISRLETARRYAAGASLVILGVTELIPGEGIINQPAKVFAKHELEEIAAKGTAQLPAKLYHYTGEGNVANIMEKGLGYDRPLTWTTPAGNLSPVQAQIELALPANRGYPGALFEIDTARLQQLGINPAVGPQRIMSTPNAGGGGIEYIFNQPIPPSAIRQVPFP